VIFTIVVASFFFTDELKNYAAVPVNAKYIPVFEALAWVIFAGSTSVAIVSFVAQRIYGSV
jgi:hypothetical protein